MFCTCEAYGQKVCVWFPTSSSAAISSGVFISETSSLSNPESGMSCRSAPFLATERWSVPSAATYPRASASARACACSASSFRCALISALFSWYLSGAVFSCFAAASSVESTLPYFW